MGENFYRPRERHDTDGENPGIQPCDRPAVALAKEQSSKGRRRIVVFVEDADDRQAVARKLATWDGLFRSVRLQDGLALEALTRDGSS